MTQKDPTLPGNGLSCITQGAGGETPSEPYVAMCDAHANEVALFHAKVLKLFHEKKITALWKETLSFFNICTCEYVISFQRFYPLNIKLVLLLALAFLTLQA